MSMYELHDQPDLQEPVLVMVLDGWIDAGFAAATAVQALLSSTDTYPVATFDTDALLDHRARRPILHLVDGVNTGLSWPGLELRAGVDEGGNDFLLLAGAEPDHRWRAFADEVIGLARRFGTRLIVGLGAYPAAVPHTRPVSLSVTASTPDLAISSGLLQGTLDVPAGVQAAVEYRCNELDLPAMGLWAQVPHYISAEPTPYHAASLALLRRLELVAGIQVDTAALEADAARTANRIDAALAANAEHVAMLRMLEARHDETMAEAGSAMDQPLDTALPSADELAAEVERFLRDQGDT